MRVRFSFLSTSICFSLSYPSYPPASPGHDSLFPPLSARSLRPFVSTIDVLVVSYSFLISLIVSPCLRSLSFSLSLFLFLLAVRPSWPFQDKRKERGKKEKKKKKKTAATMASCLPFYGTLNLSVRVRQINLHSLVDRINALLTSTRFLSANED